MGPPGRPLKARLRWRQLYKCWQTEGPGRRGRLLVRARATGVCYLPRLLKYAAAAGCQVLHTA